ncbi:MAG: sugar ABC transporter substrate-binding protein [Clostridiales bacterium]|nr:sugar ABC transporter substrate-binding protein [Clostridiales bacterium]
MKYKRLTAAIMLVAFALSGCSKAVTDETLKIRHKDIKETEKIIETDPIVPDVTEETETEPVPSTPSNYNSDILDLTMFIGYTGSEKDYGNNEIQELIAQKTGVRVKEEFLNNGRTLGEEVGAMIASGQLPDYIDAGDANVTFYENDLLVCWDPYLEMYPNLKALYTDEEWDKFRMSDGHIYWANVFGNHYNNVDTSTGHNGQAFWIQNRVLKEFGYPLVETLDDYFKLLEDYYELHPEMPDGTPIIPYTMLCEDWRYFCLECPPMYLDGYPNDGCVIVDVSDPSNPVVKDYNTSDTAKKYFKKLNEEYNKGIIDPDFDEMTYDEYIEKLSTGCVLGMCDQYWDFAYTLMYTYTDELIDLGCEYVPVGITIEAGMDNQWHQYGDEINQVSGIAVTTNCPDPNVAFKFLNDIMDPEIHNLRFWGVEGVDYYVDDSGLFYRTPEMRENWSNPDYLREHVCQYYYMPQWLGMNYDGINMMQPSEQTSEFYATLSEPMLYCFMAYGATTYADMLRSVDEGHYPWYPMWTWSNNLYGELPGGAEYQAISQTKHEYLPQVVKAKNFDSIWSEYMDAYEEADPEGFLNAAQEEVDRRLNGG